MLGKYEPPKHKRFDRLPGDVKAAVESRGLVTDGFIKVVESDMDFDGCYLTAWTALDSEGIYFILGDEKQQKSAEARKSKRNTSSERFAPIRSPILIR